MRTRVRGRPRGIERRGHFSALQAQGPGGSEALIAIERWLLAQNLRFETEESMRAEGLVVASAAMRSAIARVIAAASSGARVVLITGPSGAGKEVLARCFHRHSGRAGPFIARNCAMFSKDLVRSELFGAEKGSFAGSVQRITGAVEMANEGTLFLDEIGELPQDLQPMLLRSLDHGEYERLGAYGHSKRADVRIVAATNRDLRAAVQNETFRTDLWFRLSVHVVDVPPLRERFEDFLAYPQCVELVDLAPEIIDLLVKHPWTGNFREPALTGGEPHRRWRHLPCARAAGSPRIRRGPRRRVPADVGSDQESRRELRETDPLRSVERVCEGDGHRARRPACRSGSSESRSRHRPEAVRRYFDRFANR